jgi:hypothetical protein
MEPRNPRCLISVVSILPLRPVPQVIRIFGLGNSVVNYAGSSVSGPGRAGTLGRDSTPNPILGADRLRLRSGSGSGSDPQW